MTHPYHPLSSQDFELVEIRMSWGEERVYFLDEKQQVRTLPLSWTDAAVEDPFCVVAAGRSPFRFEDLVHLAKLIAGMGQ